MFNKYREPIRITQVKKPSLWDKLNNWLNDLPVSVQATLSLIAIIVIFFGLFVILPIIAKSLSLKLAF